MSPRIPVLSVMLLIFLFAASMVFIFGPGDEPIKYSLPEPLLASRSLAEIVEIDLDIDLSENEIDVLALDGIIERSLQAPMF